MEKSLSVELFIRNFYGSIIIKFLEDPQKDKAYFEAKIIDSNELELSIYNTDDTLGFGSEKPLLLGTLVGKKLYMNLSVSKLSAKERTIHYTFYLGEEVENE